MPVSSDAFRHALGRFASGVTVVAITDTAGGLHGLTVSAFSSLSLNPPYILVCIDKRSSSIAVIEGARQFSVNLLAADQQALSNHFASKLEDKFAGVAWYPSKLGTPILEGVLGWLECTLVQVVDAGDHVIVIGQVEHAVADESKQPLLYYLGQYGSFQ